MIWTNEQIVDKIKKLREADQVMSVAKLMAEFFLQMRDDYEARIAELESELNAMAEDTPTESGVGKGWTCFNE